MAQNLSYLWHSTFETGAVQLCPITEIAPESVFVWSCRWYCFLDDARANWYGVYLAEIKCARATGFPPFSRAYRVLVRLNFPFPLKRASSATSFPGSSVTRFPDPGNEVGLPPRLLGQKYFIDEIRATVNSESETKLLCIQMKVGLCFAIVYNLLQLHSFFLPPLSFLFVS